MLPIAVLLWACSNYCCWPRYIFHVSLHLLIHSASYNAPNKFVWATRYNVSSHIAEQLCLSVTKISAVYTHIKHLHALCDRRSGWFSTATRLRTERSRNLSWQMKRRFSSPKRPDWKWGPSSLLLNAYRGQSDRNMKLVTHLQPVPE